MSLQLWETLKESITAYTGLSAATFFTVIALLWAIYYVITSIFASPSARTDENLLYDDDSPKNTEEPTQVPAEVGEITLDELKQYDGSDPNKPLLMAIKGQIYDVSQSREFYGPGGPYALFAGKDASRALAKMSFEDKDLTGDISGLGLFELDALQDWEWRFMSKYVKVGTVKTTPSDDANKTEHAENDETPQKANPSEGATDKAE